MCSFEFGEKIKKRLKFAESKKTGDIRFGHLNAGVMAFVDGFEDTGGENFNDDERSYGTVCVTVEEGDVDTGDVTRFLLEGVIC